MARRQSNFDDQLLAMDEKIADSDETIEALHADKAAAVKRNEDTKGRLERSEEKVRTLDASINKEKEARTADRMKSEMEQEEALNTLRREHSIARAEME